MPDVETTLNGYRKDDGSPNWYYARQRTDADAHDTDSGGSPSIGVATTVRDGRGLNLTLEQNGVQLVPQLTSLSTADFYDVTKIKSTYYAEMVETIKHATGAEKVVIFHHQVRLSADRAGSLLLCKASLRSSTAPSWTAARTACSAVAIQAEAELCRAPCYRVDRTL